MSFQELERTLKAQICESVRIVTNGNGKHYITMPFFYGDGDGPTIALRRQGDGWAMSDEGSTMMRLSWRLSEEEFEEPERQSKIADALALSQAKEKDGELLLQVSDSNYSEALFDFVHSLLIVDELGYPDKTTTSRELESHVDVFEEVTSFALAPTASMSAKRRLMPMREFKRGFADIVRESLPHHKLNFGWSDPSWDPAGNYVVDCMVNGMDAPLFLHAPGSNVQARDATITIYRFNDQRVGGRHATVFRDASKLTRKVTSQLKAVCDVTFDNFEREREGIREFLNTLR